MNFLKETRRFLALQGRTPSEVKWVGSQDGVYAVSWEVFESIADFEYYKYQGRYGIARDLVVVGQLWWLSRSEIGGVPVWVHNEQPRKIGDRAFDSLMTVKDAPTAYLRYLNPIYRSSRDTI